MAEVQAVLNENNLMKGVNARLATLQGLYEGENYESIRPGEFHERYSVLAELGRGSFSVVRECVDRKSRRRFAVKVLKKNPLHQKSYDDEDDVEVFKRTQREIHILAKVEHPNIVTLFRVYESPKKIYLLMELVTGGEVFDQIVKNGSFHEEGARRITFQLVSALKYLHERSIVHRDIKPENLLCVSGRSGQVPDIKLTDFGLSTIIEDDSMLVTSCGTPTYLAPEIINRRPYTSQVDLWSVGVTAYILLCGFPPFYDENTAVLYDLICDGTFGFPEDYWKGIGEGARDFIQKLLVTDPEQRMTAEQALQHPWLNTQGSLTDRPHVISGIKAYTAKGKWRIVATVPRAISRMRALSQDTVRLLEAMRHKNEQMRLRSQMGRDSLDSTQDLLLDGACASPVGMGAQGKESPLSASRESQQDPATGPADPASHDGDDDNDDDDNDNDDDDNDDNDNDNDGTGDGDGDGGGGGDGGDDKGSGGEGAPAVAPVGTDAEAVATA